MNKISHGQKLFLSKVKRHRMIVLFARLLILILFLAIWEVCANTGHHRLFYFQQSLPDRTVLLGNG